jgi:hypothetical protein
LREHDEEGGPERLPEVRVADAHPIRGVRIAQLGKEPVEVTLPAGSSKTIQQLIDEALLPSGADMHYLVNMQRVGTDHAVQNGDTVVSVKSFVAG